MSTTRQQHERGADGEASPKVASARPIDDTAVRLALWNEGAHVRGPWSYVVEVPSQGKELAAPPPGYLGLAGWAA